MINELPSPEYKKHQRQNSFYTVTLEPIMQEEQSETESEEDNKTNIFVKDPMDCGLLYCRPLFIQKFANIKVFVGLLLFLITIQQAITSGYVFSVLTTIEKRFEIPSSLAGLVTSSYELGNLMTVIFVSFLGSRRHIPVWIGTGAVVMGLGCLIFLIPHFTSEENKKLSMNLEPELNICYEQRNETSPHIPSDFSSKQFIHEPPSVTGPVLMFILGQFLLGGGYSPVFTLGTIYIDDNMPSNQSTIYIAAMYSMSVFGPLLGFLLGAGLLSVHMDFLSKYIEIESWDKRWVGMWWGGFFLGGVLLLITAIPFFYFPKSLTQEPKPKHNYGKTVKDIPKSVWRLISNKIYLVTNLGSCMDHMVICGMLVFLSKYLENEFSMGKSQSNIFIGIIAIPSAFTGVFLGGYILKRLVPTPKAAIRFILLSNIISLGCLVLLFFVGCENVAVAGLTSQYQNVPVSPLAIKLTSECNLNCSCETFEFDPVCGQDGVTYFSPCHAGCKTKNNFTYSNCTCVDVKESQAVDGICKKNCLSIYAFSTILFFMSFVAALSQIPQLTLTLRSVEEEERAFALGLQFVIIRLFGYIPAPIFFGSVIDTACLLWKKDSTGRCLLYDLEKFRYKYTGLNFGLKYSSFAIFLLDYYLINKKVQLEEKMLTVKDLIGSVINLDNVLAEHAFRGRKNLSFAGMNRYSNISLKSRSKKSCSL